MSEFGRSYYLMPAALALGTIGYTEKNEKLLDASFTSVESGLTAGILTTGIKALIGRERPYATNNPFKFKPFSITSRTKYHSFPSGHTIMAWAMITPYAVYYNHRN
jgi:membrane-associated phospholipid phosphatase